MGAASSKAHIWTDYTGANLLEGNLEISSTEVNPVSVSVSLWHKVCGIKKQVVVELKHRVPPNFPTITSLVPQC